MAEIEKHAQQPPAYSSPAPTPLTLASPQQHAQQAQVPQPGTYAYPGQQQPGVVSPQQQQMQPQMQQMQQPMPQLVQNPDGTYAYAQYPANYQYAQQTGQPLQQQPQPGQMVELPGGQVQQVMELPTGQQVPLQPQPGMPQQQQQPMQQVPQQPTMVYQQQGAQQPQMVQSQATLVNQPQPAGTFVMASHTGTMMMQPVTPLANLGPASSIVNCPSCHQTTRTSLSFLVGDCTHLWALGFCFVTCLPCIPYFIDTFHDVQHKCSNCGALLATFQRSGGTNVHV